MSEHTGEENTKCLHSEIQANAEPLFKIMESHDKNTKEYAEGLLELMKKQEIDSEEMNASFVQLVLTQAEESHKHKKEALKCLQSIGINQPFNRNLILNPSGKECFNFWEITNGGDGIIVEDSPQGTDLIPEEAGLLSQHCFVTSYNECERMQQLDLHSVGVTPWVMDQLKPSITASEWVSARWDCDSWTELTLLLLKDQEVVETKKVSWSSKDCGVEKRQWYKIEVSVQDYPCGVTSIKYLSRGKDHQYWAGHYGTKSAGSALHLHL